jgi:hypothetical protein
MPFDQVWSALIRGVGKSFFSIDEFEKESGLLTLSFSTSPFSDSVTGGHLAYRVEESTVAGRSLFDLATSSAGTKRTVVDFDGDYADFIEGYLDGTLLGKINLVVTAVTPEETRIAVNTRFIVTANMTETLPSISHHVTWSWTSPDQCTRLVHAHDGMQERRLQSTFSVEQRILDSIDALVPDD